MYSIRGNNVNEIYPVGIMMLREKGHRQPSQHGDTLEMDQPVSVMYDNPRERCLFDAVRDSNPFLNLFEALWIIAGRNDVKFLNRLVPQMKNYSDNGETYYGAYGWRMRKCWDGEKGFDQVEEAIKRLTANPNDRQVVLQIRKPADMVYEGKDQPCNLMIACKIRDAKLNIHVFNRSNDFVWGLTGTNVVQFSMLQEYMAGRIGVEVGTYHQTTDSMHVYDNEQWAKVKDTSLVVDDPYATAKVAPYPMMVQHKEGHWDADLETFFFNVDQNHQYSPMVEEYLTPFFQNVVVPMWETFYNWERYRETKQDTYLQMAIHMSAEVPADWGLMTNLWLSRRVK